LNVKAAGMKISTDHLPFRLSSETVMNSPLPPRLTKAVVLNGCTVVLIALGWMNLRGSIQDAPIGNALTINSH
jgi:hypothetical protein